MRVFAWFMIVVVVLAAGVVGYSMWAAALQVGDVRLAVVPADQMLGEYEALRLDAQYDALKATIYQRADWNSAQDYDFHVYTVQLKNRGFLKAEWIELSLPEGAPTDGLILLETPQTPLTLDSFSQGTVQATLLARADTTPSSGITLTYFVFGRPYSIPLEVQTQ